MFPELEETLLRCISVGCRVVQLDDKDRRFVAWIPQRDYVAFVNEAGLAAILENDAGEPGIHPVPACKRE